MQILNFSIKKIISFAKNKKIVCFGTGIIGRRFGYILRQWGLSENVAFYVDNDNNKIGKTIDCLGDQL